MKEKGRKLICLLLALVLLLGILPAGSAAAEPQAEEGAEAPYVFTEEDNALVDNDVFARISEVEAEEIRPVRGRPSTPEDYVRILPQVIGAVESSETYVDGSLVRNGDFIWWRASNGMACAYHPYMEAIEHGWQDPELAAEEEIPEELEALLQEETAEPASRGGTPGVVEIALVQPYWDNSDSEDGYLDANFCTNDPTFKGLWEDLCAANGSSADYRYTLTNASVDNIARCMEDCGLVILHSHGVTDCYGRVEDFELERANSSYVMLTTGDGLTDEDMQAVDGVNSTSYCHAYRFKSGKSMVDGTCIANHMKKSAQNSFVYLGMCYGMATDGLCAPLRAKGVQAVLGFSRPVTFYGDEKYAEALLPGIQDGKMLAAALARAKDFLGNWDPGSNVNTLEQAQENEIAFPIVVSDEDAYPGKGNVQNLQTVKSLWHLNSNPIPLSGTVETAFSALMGYTIHPWFRGDAKYIPRSALRFQWQRYEYGDWVDIGDATDYYYTVKPADANRDVRVQVSGAPDLNLTGTLESNPCHCSANVDVALDATRFPDYYFRQYLKDKFDTNNDGKLSGEEIRKIYEIHLNVAGENYHNVASLEGIQYLVELEYLYANHTKITDFDGTGLDLYALDLSECPLDSLTLNDNAFLRELYLSNLTGSLKELDLSHTPQLMVLETYGCKISHLDISKCPYLVEAALYGEVTNNDRWRDHRISKYHRFINDGYDHNVTVAHFDEAFPDATFRGILQDNQNINWDLDNNLTISEAKDVVNLDLGDWEDELESVRGVEYLPNLEFLAAFNCSLEVAGLSRNSKLNYLDLDRNHISYLDLSNNTSLKTLYCSFNYLFDLTLGENSALTLLDAEENYLMSLDVSGLSALEDLWLDVNLLESLDVSGNPALEKLGVSNNFLTKLDLSHNPALKNLTCYGNAISTLDISACPNLVSAFRGTRTEHTDSDTGMVFWSYQDAKGNVLNVDKFTKIIDKNPFADVKPGKYYYTPVLWSYYHDPQITNGTDDTHFSPNKDCTRAQIVTFLWKAAGAPEPETSNNPFTDVKEGKYYYKAVLWAVENGVTNGVSADTFGVNQPCKREQAVTFLWKFAGSPEPKTAENPFADVKEGKFYYKAVLWALENEVTNGVSANQFGVGKTCTRGQIVTFLYNFMET